MTTVIPVPSLSAAGWVTDASGKADALLSHFFEAYKSQSYLYKDNVTSLQWLIEHYGHDSTELNIKITSALENYLGRYYDSVVVSVEISDIAETSNTMITLHCSVIDNGTTYSIGKLLEVSDSSIVKIVTSNNG